ncbi:MAG TPA: TonB-dependent receptor [Bryobacteraceae bacterium]
MRLIRVLTLLSAFSLIAFAQTSGGTITGTISDPAGAVVAAAQIQARNTETGANYPVASSNTGNYTMVDLPPGTYELSVTVPGFKKYVRPGLIVQTAQTIRVDAVLEVGAATESVTVQEEAPLLKTEGGEIANTVATETMNTLPLLDLGTNGAGIRNPYNLVAIVPGAYFSPPVPGGVGTTVHINGGVTQSERVLIEGMDGTNALGQGANAQAQPGQDQVQEWTVQASNYAAEFGQAGSSVMTVTMKSGTNQFHGSVYDYYQNAFLNAGQPFTNNGKGSLVRPGDTQEDYGFTIGGPLRIPKVYDGRNRTFFFFNWEAYDRKQTILPAVTTVPTQAYRNGDFSAAILTAGSKNIGTDPLGRPIIADTIYDPLTQSVAPNGQLVTNPFPNNQIPMSRISPIATKIESLIPMPLCTAGGVCNALGSVNNFQNSEFEHRTTSVPSVKVDQIIGPKDKLSFFWNRTATYCLTCYADDGWPQPISETFGGAIYAKNLRLNYDHTLAPTLLLHLGIGYNSDDLGAPAVTTEYNACSNLGLCSGAFTQPSPFPAFTGLNDTVAGGSQSIATGGPGDSIYNQVNAIASLTWVHGNHTFKFGGEMLTQGNYAVTHHDLQGTYGFSPAETAMPYVATITGGVGAAAIGANHIGLPYAGFLLGLVDSANIDPPSDSRFGKHQTGFYAQDSWKVTRKFTLNLGLRYDYSTWYQEQYGRSPNFDPTLANPAAGGHPGATLFQATCNCAFAHNYPWGLGPRFGFAYQVADKTVIRGGAGIVYTGTGVGTTFGGAYGSAAASNPFNVSVPGSPVMTLSNIAINGNPITPAQIAWPNLSSSYYPIGGIVPGTGPQYYDPNGGRPARQYQYSFGIEREVIRDLAVEVSYVGNMGIWWPTSTTGLTNLVNYNYLSNSLLSQYSLSLNNPANLAILLAPVGSAAAGPFQNHIPFTGFPLTATVAQSLRPFPQFNAGLNPLSPPLGDSMYNGLQATVNKRFSHGLQLSFGFTWSKEMNDFGGTQDIQNRGLAWRLGTLDQPFATKIGYSYTTPKWGLKVVSAIVRDWTYTGFLYYASGTPLTIPSANTLGYPSNLTTATMANVTFQPVANPQDVVMGQSLFNDILNCHCFDPNKTFVLNAAVWQNPGPGQFGTSGLLPNFRGERRPVENMGIGRTFRFKERASLNIRAEFNNIFNHTYLNNPSLTSPQTPAVCVLPNGTNGACSPGETIVSGFGSINTSTTAFPNRVGQLVARITF